MEIEPLDIPTGVSALIRGDKPGKTICIRHDIHTVVALYCAKLLNERRGTLAGNVRIVFQPAEETVTGAKQTVKAGIMELQPLNDLVVGLHTHPLTPVSSICHRKHSRRADA